MSVCRAHSGGSSSDHEIRTVAQAGWSGMRNSVLLAAAAREYDALITVDKLLVRQRTDASKLIVITLEARTNRLESLRPLVPGILRSLETAAPGATLDLRA